MNVKEGGDLVGAVSQDKWIEIDLDLVRQNYKEVSAVLDEKVRMIAVIKADAYGHGLGEIARFLYQNGVDFFAVSYLGEALELRRQGLKANILIFAPLINKDEITEAINNNITISLTSVNEGYNLAAAAAETNRPITVHLKIDTGLGRFGMSQEEALQVCECLQGINNVYIEGIYTHMAHAANKKYTYKQFNKFMEIIACLEKDGFNIPVKHCANSTVFLKYPEMHLNAVRIGTLLSGQYPVGDYPKVLAIRDPFVFKSRVLSIRTLPKGSYLGYFRTYRLKKEAQIAVIPVGFKDGLMLEVDNPPTGFIDLLKIIIKKILVYCQIERFRPKIKIAGKYYPIRGKVFMQMALVEIPPTDTVKVGDEVEIPVRKTLTDKSLSRFYIRDGQIGKQGKDDKYTYLIEEV